MSNHTSTGIQQIESGIHDSHETAVAALTHLMKTAAVSVREADKRAENVDMLTSAIYKLAIVSVAARNGRVSQEEAEERVLPSIVRAQAGGTNERAVRAMELLEEVTSALIYLSGEVREYRRRYKDLCNIAQQGAQALRGQWEDNPVRTIEMSRTLVRAGQLEEIYDLELD